MLVVAAMSMSLTGCAEHGHTRSVRVDSTGANFGVGTATVAIPPGALPVGSAVHFGTTAAPTPATPGVTLLGSAIEIDAAAALAKPARLTFTVPHDVAKSFVSPAWYDASHSRWTPVGSDRVIAHAGQTVAVDVPHFSTYGLMSVLGSVLDWFLPSDTDPPTCAVPSATFAAESNARHFGGTVHVCVDHGDKTVDVLRITDRRLYGQRIDAGSSLSLPHGVTLDNSEHLDGTNALDNLVLNLSTKLGTALVVPEAQSVLDLRRDLPLPTQLHVYVDALSVGVQAALTFAELAGVGHLSAEDVERIDDCMVEPLHSLGWSLTAGNVQTAIEKGVDAAVSCIASFVKGGAEVVSNIKSVVLDEGGAIGSALRDLFANGPGGATIDIKDTMHLPIFAPVGAYGDTVATRARTIRDLAASDSLSDLGGLLPSDGRFAADHDIRSMSADQAYELAQTLALPPVSGVCEANGSVEGGWVYSPGEFQALSWDRNSKNALLTALTAIGVDEATRAQLQRGAQPTGGRFPVVCIESDGTWRAFVHRVFDSRVPVTHPNACPRTGCPTEPVAQALQRVQLCDGAGKCRDSRPMSLGGSSQYVALVGADAQGRVAVATGQQGAVHLSSIEGLALAPGERLDVVAEADINGPALLADAVHPDGSRTRYVLGWAGDHFRTYVHDDGVPLTVRAARPAPPPLTLTCADLDGDGRVELDDSPFEDWAITAKGGSQSFGFTAFDGRRVIGMPSRYVFDNTPELSKIQKEDGFFPYWAPACAIYWTLTYPLTAASPLPAANLCRYTDYDGVTSSARAPSAAQLSGVGWPAGSSLYVSDVPSLGTPPALYDAPAGYRCTAGQNNDGGVFVSVTDVHDKHLAITEWDPDSIAVEGASLACPYIARARRSYALSYGNVFPGTADPCPATPGAIIVAIPTGDADSDAVVVGFGPNTKTADVDAAGHGNATVAVYFASFAPDGTLEQTDLLTCTLPKAQAAMCQSTIDAYARRIIPGAGASVIDDAVVRARAGQ